MQNRIFEIVKGAQQDKRSVLYEYEVYELLTAAKLQTPRYVFVKQGESLDVDKLNALPGSKVVLKAVSQHILHKSDVGGVNILAKDPEVIQAAIAEMYQSIPGAYQEWLDQSGKELPQELNTGDDSSKQIANSIVGVMLIEMVPFEQDFGCELLLGARWSREFGPVVTFGVGGTDAEYYAANMRKGAAHAIRSAVMLDREMALDMLRQTIVFDRITGATRSAKKRISENDLVELILNFANLVRMFSPDNPEAPCLLKELEINPLVISGNQLVPLDGLMRLEDLPAVAIEKPLHKIDNLLHSKNVALIGVSQKMNVGRIILQNLLDNDYPIDNIKIVKADTDEIAGVVCVPNIAALPEKVDVLVLAVSAAQVPDMLEEICLADKAESIIVIPGGIAEKEGGEVIQQRIDRVIAEARTRKGGGPVINGSNCLGIYARESGFNSLFIPEYKLPKPSKSSRSRIAYLSQSGAFMICRMSRITGLDPVYAVSLGNQMDLTIGDFVEFLHDDPDVDILACYVEGFGDLDGLKTALKANELAKSGKKVLLYKAGRTAEGQSASAGHTASLAGDYETCRQVMLSAGVEMLEIFQDFESRVRMYHSFEGKISAKGEIANLGVISNAGFECVGIADNLDREVFGGDIKMKLATFGSDTRTKLGEVFKAGRLDTLVDVKNPLDLTPMATDAVWAECVKTMLEDPTVDAAIVSIVPLTAAMQTLPISERHREDLTSTDAICAQLARIREYCDTPFVVAIDSGDLYHDMVVQLESAGIPVFPFSDQATRFLGRYLDAQK
jgi:acyl-CoA synthetase (NDP forming)